MDRRVRELITEANKARGEAMAPAQEVLEHLYQSLLAVPEFTLKDGTKARLDPYYAPEVDDDGELRCGVDVLLDNGSHLEFTMANTGWGKSLAVVRQKKRHRRHGETR